MCLLQAILHSVLPRESNSKACIMQQIYSVYAFYISLLINTDAVIKFVYCTLFTFVALVYWMLIYFQTIRAQKLQVSSAILLSLLKYFQENGLKFRF